MCCTGGVGKHGALKVIFSSFYRGELTHKVVPYAHTVVVCVVKGRGGEPLINMGPLKLFSTSFLRGIDPNSGSVNPHSGCLYCKGVKRETPENHGALKVAFQ